MVSSLDRRRILAAGLAATAGLGLTRSVWGDTPDTPQMLPGGWIPDSPDPRDRLLVTPLFASPGPRPASVDLSEKFPTEPWNSLTELTAGTQVPHAFQWSLHCIARNSASEVRTEQREDVKHKVAA